MSSDVDIQESVTAKPHENNTPSHKELVPEETLSTPPISTQSSPSLQLKNSDLPIVQEESEDDRSIDSEGEEKKGINRNKTEKERLSRRDSHPLDDPGKGKDTKKGPEEVPVGGKGTGGGQGEIDASGDSNRLQETTPTMNDVIESECI